MITEQLRSRYDQIVSLVLEKVSLNVDKEDLTQKVDYASIYAQGPEDLETVSKELEANGAVALQNPSGDYYRLTSPLNIAAITINLCRVRRFDIDHPELGYADIEVQDFEGFKRKYLPRPHFSLLNSSEEMVELRNPNFNVRAYFIRENS